MDLTLLTDRIGEPLTAVSIGLFVGILFGAAAQRSAFCLRAATVEFSRWRFGPRMAVWLLTFSSAAVWVQGAAMMGWFNPAEARMMAVPGSWSGAIIGGLIFGAGMIMARGCPGRLLVLAATGNLRSILSGLIFAVFAQMALYGWLAPFRTWLASLWITPGGRNVNVMAAIGLPPHSGLYLGLFTAALALYVARRNRIAPSRLIFGAGVGVMVAAGFFLTYSMSQISFDPVSVTSITFTGPSANTLMLFLVPGEGFSFDVGLVPGVFIGSFIAAALARELQFQTFENTTNTRRAMLGACMMGFGGMLAGGCSIGNGVSGSSLFAGTAWVALTAMWVGGIATDWLLDRGSAHAA